MHDREPPNPKPRLDLAGYLLYDPRRHRLVDLVVDLHYAVAGMPLSLLILTGGVCTRCLAGPAHEQNDGSIDRSRNSSLEGPERLRVNRIR